MLEELTVRNYALIDEVTVRFAPGCNVLSGETGAGKSILVDALSLILGGKGKADGIRQGADEAEVAAVFRVELSPEINEWIRRHEIKPEDGTMLIRRTLRSNGRGSVSIQAVPVTLAVLAEIGSLLVDIHGQHEHQSLFHNSAHRRLLDRFSGLEDSVSQFGKLFMELTDCGKRLEKLIRKEQEMKKESDFLRFAAEEIESGQFKENEESELIENQKILSRSQELIHEIETAMGFLTGGERGVVSLLMKGRDSLKRASSIDGGLSDLFSRIESAFFEIEDAAGEVRRYRDTRNFNLETLSAVDERLSRISMLEKKYGVNTLADLIAYGRNARNTLQSVENLEDEKLQLKAQKTRLEKAVIEEAARISSKRKEAAGILQGRVEQLLHVLGMGNACFLAKVEARKNNSGKPAIGIHGVDEIEFLLSANRGESPRPLKSVASGGELSRVMLAVKSILSESDQIPTMVFDEIDSGIGGEVARSVGIHMQKISSDKQVFCVTHLASIAVFADNHIQVEKGFADGRTVTRVRSITGEGRIREVARMLAGDSRNSVSLDHASRLLEESVRTVSKEGR